MRRTADEIEAELMNALRSYGSVRDLSRATKIHVSRIYGLLDGLMDRGEVSFREERNLRGYTVKIFYLIDRLSKHELEGLKEIP